jgi:CTP synthase (UTP-ammonia lyase)
MLTTDTILGAAAVSDLLQCSEKQAEELMRDRELAATKIGRGWVTTYAHVLAWMSACSFWSSTIQRATARRVLGTYRLATWPLATSRNSRAADSAVRQLIWRGRIRHRFEHNHLAAADRAIGRHVVAAVSHTDRRDFQ